jgi:hypothetical protein
LFIMGNSHGIEVNCHVDDGFDLRGAHTSLASATDWRCWHGTSLGRKMSRWGERSRRWKRAATASQHTGCYRQPGTDKLNTLPVVESVVVADSWADALATIHLQRPQNYNQQTTTESIIDTYKIEWNKEGMQHTRDARKHYHNNEQDVVSI